MSSRRALARHGIRNLRHGKYLIGAERMRVLIGMSVMAHRTGAELFVRDLALSLNSRGHSVIVYAPIMGEMVEELRWRSIACVTDLAMVGSAPDVIMGNTQMETVACLARFPQVPAISICHDRTAPHGKPPRFSRIRRYVAVDANCWERLVLEEGIPEESVQIIQNGVDLLRFRPRSRLPGKPSKAAIFSNYATASAETAAAREACRARGIDLSIIGAGTGNQARLPEEVLPEYDLVFAKARCAMEAMAVGCAVVLFNEGMGMGDLVTPENMAEWHRWNFGRKLLQLPINAARIGRAIDSYSAAGGEDVSRYVRQHASLAVMTDAFEQLAASIVAREPDREKVAAEQESGEFAEFVCSVLKPPGPAMVAIQVGMLLERVEEREQQLRRVNQRLMAVEHQLAAVHASRSWRLTEPVRRLIAAISRLLRRVGIQ